MAMNGPATKHKLQYTAVLNRTAGLVAASHEDLCWQEQLPSSCSPSARLLGSQPRMRSLLASYSDCRRQHLCPLAGLVARIKGGGLLPPLHAFSIRPIWAGSDISALCYNEAILSVSIEVVSLLGLELRYGIDVFVC